MKDYFLSFLLALLVAGTISTRAAEDITPKSSDLKGWVVLHDGEWKVEDGVLIGRNGTNWTTNPKKSGSWLRTEKEYGNFVLELEYAINARGNSGIFIRSGLEENPAFTGYELQINDDHGRPAAKYTSGSLYDVVAPKKNMSKPAGEWNQVKIEAIGKKIKAWVNGEEIIDYEADRRTKGYIGLQNHDARSVVKFRNIRITEKK